ncbi:hypothetical protein GQ44DRAFT_692446 [Phaeosphaeriaceae sp. PMI808]|nr:hypothetical protein GQ44DRAFT_692446 [Phaeosphaeriaceae sp. PMI808]
MLASVLNNGIIQLRDTATGASLQGLNHGSANVESYTVGWVCALTTEFVVAQVFLDEKHVDPTSVSPQDNNSYALGRIGNHNVVIAVLPIGDYDMASAAGVARDMLHSFPNIKIVLMVGIGGGVPSSKHDVRLGDVVVGSPRGGTGRVVQYDYGKTIQDRKFQPMGFLNQPPTVLRTAIAGLRSQYEIEGHQFNEAIENVFARKPRLRRRYQRPSIDSDRLYHPNIIHPPNADVACAEACGSDPSQLILRQERGDDEDNPTVHYGIIASGNQLMKDALLRDKIGQENDILCFEMEAAGLMNHFPCLVIRGICDYSDTHKNKEWQGYAAMVAAAYAKDLLYRIPPNKIETEKNITMLTFSHIGVFQIPAKQQKDHTGVNLEIHHENLKRKVSEEERECLQLFRLTRSDKDVTYEWYKNRIDNRIEGTCEWLLKHDEFQKWAKQESGLLLISADPGCGKSVLAKYLINSVLPQSATVCYFFFKEQDQNTLRQALCALLHQLFSKNHSLIHHAMEHYKKDGPRIINSTHLLWNILESAVIDPQAGPHIFVLDALDECIESECSDLVRRIESRSRSGQFSQSKIKYLLTSRPYDHIVSQFRGFSDSFPYIRIPGEEESEIISQEINYVVEYRVERLGERLSLSKKIKDELLDKLLKIQHRTYLWVYLLFDHLETVRFKKTLKGIQSAISVLPESVDQAYEQILNKSKEIRKAQQVLAIILAANRPLTLKEMNTAVNIDNTVHSISDLDLEDPDDFRQTLRSWCGLFVSVNHGKIYFLHETAREFLLRNLSSSVSIDPVLRWHHFITIYEAHAVLAEICMRFINCVGIDIDLTPDARRYIRDYPFSYYATNFWDLHFREAFVSDDDATMIDLALSCHNQKNFAFWGQFREFVTESLHSPFPTDLVFASFCGLNVVVKRLLITGAEVNAQNSGKYGNALYAASNNGYGQVVKLLLATGADVNAQGGYYGNALQAASYHGSKEIVELLLAAGADVNAQGGEYGNALQAASIQGSKEIVELLLTTGADVNAQGGYYGNALQAASYGGSKEIIELLLAAGADVNAQDGEYSSALQAASYNRDKEVVELLLDAGADVNAHGGEYGNALQAASSQGSKEIVELLLAAGAEVNAQGGQYGSALQAALDEGDEEIAELLLAAGAKAQEGGSANTM